MGLQTLPGSPRACAEKCAARGLGGTSYGAERTIFHAREFVSVACHEWRGAADRFGTPELPVSGAKDAEKFQTAEPPKPPEPQVEHQSSGPMYGHSADHSKFEALKGPFADNFAVTKACATCHTEAEAHIKKTIHWTWDYVNPRTGQHLGKENVINNFCTNAKDNEGMCGVCHIGNGVKAGEQYAFNKQTSVDCLVCHDRTGKYYRLPPTRGNSACAAMFEGRHRSISPRSPSMSACPAARTAEPAISTAAAATASSTATSIRR